MQDASSHHGQMCRMVRRLAVNQVRYACWEFESLSVHITAGAQGEDSGSYPDVAEFKSPIRYHMSIAQLVERPPPKRLGVGSIPTRHARRDGRVRPIATVC